MPFLSFFIKVSVDDLLTALIIMLSLSFMLYLTAMFILGALSDRRTSTTPESQPLYLQTIAPSMLFTVADSTPAEWAQYRTSQLPNTAAPIELIAIIAGIDLDTAQRLIDAIASPANLFTPEQVWGRFRHVTSSQLQQVKGISQKRSARILAALELGKRVCAAPPILPMVDDPAVAANLLKYDLAYSEVERFAVIVLNIKHRAIAKEVISVGSKTECVAHPGEIFRSVLKHNGTRCIVAHNHPSGSVEPSPDDVSLTRSLLAGGQTLGIPVLDHLILSGEEWYSFRQQTQLWQDIAQGDQITGK
jgi:DNA repair protein RadC